MVKLTSKIRAFTILESMVSIVIVMIAFSLSSLVIINVTSSGMTRKKQNAYMLVNAFRNESINENRWFDETIEVGGLRIEKTIEIYQNSNELKTLFIRVYDGEKNVSESKELIKIREEE